MSIFHGMNISASGLTAQRLRMDVVASNIANSESTRATTNEDGEWQPYRRKVVAFQNEGMSFSSHLNLVKNKMKQDETSGVRATSIREDETPFKLVYNPAHPDANEAGYVEMPNVDPLKEMVDLMSATRSYEANVTAFNASKGLLMKALEIGK